jgi:hypothetical protein
MAAAPNIKVNAPEKPLMDSSFEPYGRLLRMLMPSVGSVVVHDGFANLVWASDEADLADAPEIITETISNALAEGSEFAGIVRTLDADRVVYSFAIRGERIELLGIVSMIARLSGKQTEARALNYVRPLIQPALECLRREMLLRLQLGSREQDLGGRERDLSLMLEISSHHSASASDTDEFGLILKTGLDHMHCALAALWVPEKDIVLTLTRSGQPMSPEALQRA